MPVRGLSWTETMYGYYNHCRLQKPFHLPEHCEESGGRREREDDIVQIIRINTANVCIAFPHVHLTQYTCTLYESSSKLLRLIQKKRKNNSIAPAWNQYTKIDPRISCDQQDGKHMRIPIMIFGATSFLWNIINMYSAHSTYAFCVVSN